MNWQPISEQVWDGIRAEFTLPAVGQVHQRLSELMEDPDPVMKQLVRVFIDEGTYCPGFQFLAGGQVHPTVRNLFVRAMALKIPHNCFSAWMVTPSKTLAGSRPVDVLNDPPPSLFLVLEIFAQEHTQAQRPGVKRSRTGHSPTGIR